MNIAIVYDSVFGNTAQVAAAIASELERDNSVRLAAVETAKDLDLAGTDLIVIGSPTRGFRPTPRISDFVGGLAPVATGAMAAVFDTRMDLGAVKSGPLRWVVKVGGYAGGRIDELLQGKGYARKGDIAGFLVTDLKGPLKQGEIERAAAWARTLV